MGREVQWATVNGRTEHLEFAEQPAFCVCGGVKRVAYRAVKKTGSPLIDKVSDAPSCVFTTTKIHL